MSKLSQLKSSARHDSGSAIAVSSLDENGERWISRVFLVFLLSLFASALWLLFVEPEHFEQPLAAPGVSPLETLIIHEPIQPLPLQVDLDSRKVTLGQRLFYEPRLSGDGTIACANCHDLSRGGADGKVVATGIGGALGKVNTISVFNTAYQLAWFWDGRASTLEEQIDGPVLNPGEMGSNWEDVVDKLKQEQEYVTIFTNIYHDGITIDNIKNAIIAFEKSLVTPNSPFDKFLRGDPLAINEDEKKGYQLFKDYGCIACHQGMNVGGNMFQIFGVAKDYFEKRGNITQADQGRFNVTGLVADKHYFRVPSLRNVALTAPYFHDGSRVTLEQAVYAMAEYQLGRTITPDDIKLIVRFLHTLTGEYTPQGD